MTVGIWEQDTAETLFGSIPDSVKLATVRSIRGNMVVSNQRNTNVLKVTFSSADPAEAALLANTMVELYTSRDQDWPRILMVNTIVTISIIIIILITGNGI